MPHRAAHSPPIRNIQADPKTSHYHLNYVGPWSFNDMAANQATAVRGTWGDPTGSANSARTIRIERPCILRTMSVTLSAAQSAGAARFRVFVNGTDQTGADNENSILIDTAVDNAGLIEMGIQLQRGDLVDPRFTTSATWAPTTADARVTLGLSDPEFP